MRDQTVPCACRKTPIDIHRIGRSMAQQTHSRVAILAGGGHVPVEAAIAANQSGHAVLVVGVAGEADLSDLPPDIENTQVEWGQIGGLMKLLDEHETDKLIIVGGIAKRPDYRSLQLDWGTVQMLPKILTAVLAGGDSSVLEKIAGLFSERGFALAGVHEVAPSLLAGEGRLAGPKASTRLEDDAKHAARAAWTAGHLDMGQGAVVVNGRVVAMEGAEGTDALLQRVCDMRAAKRFSAKGASGVLAKCLRPRQDRRMDVPVIGPQTIIHAHAAELAGLLLEADGVLISKREETFALCKQYGIALWACHRSVFVPKGQEDRPA